MNKKITAFLVLLAVAALGVAFKSEPVSAQDAYGVGAARIARTTSYVARGVGADDTDVPLLVKWVGTAASGLVEVAVTSVDITFTSGATGSEAADTSLECPVSGALGGIIDVSNAACDTMGEVVDIINASTNWRAVILDGFRADSSNTALVTMAATAANSPDGLELLRDTSQIFLSRVLVAPPSARKMSFYLGGTRKTFVENPFAQLTTVLFNSDSVSTYASGTSTWSFRCSLVKHVAGTSTESVITYAKPSAASTTANAFSFPFGLGCPAGYRGVVALTNSAAMSSHNLYAGGIVF